MADEFEQFRDAMAQAASRNGRVHTPSAIEDRIELLLDNQRVICATLAMLCRGGQPPIEMGKDLQDRAKRITKILEG